MSVPQSYSAIADGSINPCRFIRKSSSTESRIVQCTAGGQCDGISQHGARRIDYIDSSGIAATAGEPLTYFGPGSRVLLDIAGTVSQGARLKSDSDGKGVTTTTNLDEWGAVADQSGTSGQRIWVTVVFPSQISAS
jgi:hypothetical protein